MNSFTDLGLESIRFKGSYSIANLNCTGYASLAPENMQMQIQMAQTEAPFESGGNWISI